MTEVKSPDVLLRAFARLGDRGVDATLAMVGDGPLRPALEELAAGLGVADRVRFLGFREDVGSLYAAADVVALSSTVEGTPVTLIEALAAGRPVVSTDIDGVADVVQGDGLLVPLGDDVALADAMHQLAGDAALRKTFGTRGAERVRREYAVERLIDDVDRLYRRLLAARGVAAPAD
jgi:glycosyltransferase involved in cell wall biosynthesis